MTTSGPENHAGPGQRRGADADQSRDEEVEGPRRKLERWLATAPTWKKALWLLALLATIGVSFWLDTRSGEQAIARLPTWVLIAFATGMGVVGLVAAFTFGEREHAQMNDAVRWFPRLLAKLPLPVLRTLFGALGVGMFGAAGYVMLQ